MILKHWVRVAIVAVSIPTVLGGFIALCVFFPEQVGVAFNLGVTGLALLVAVAILIWRSHLIVTAWWRAPDSPKRDGGYDD